MVYQLQTFDQAQTLEQLQFAMARRGDTMTEQETQSAATDNTPRGGIQNGIRAVLIGASVVAAIPTVMNLGLALQKWVPISELEKSYHRERLFNRNFGDLPKTSKPIAISNDKLVVLGAYKSGDVFVQVVKPKSGESLFMEWLGREQMTTGNKDYSIWDILFSVAKADEAKPIRVAQSIDYKIKCAWKPQGGKATRVVQVNGKCYKESFSPFTGKSDPRQELESCANACDGADVNYDKG